MIKKNKKKQIIILNTKFKKGDKVKIISGKHKNHIGLIIQILRKKNRVIIEGITVKKNKKPTQNNSESGIIEIKTSIHISNIMILDNKKPNKITKIAYQINKVGKKIRISRKSGLELR